MKELGKYRKDTGILDLCGASEDTIDETVEKEREKLNEIDEIRKEYQNLVSIIHEEIGKGRTTIPGEIFWMLEETNYNMNVSILLALSAYYRHAHLSLRSMLEFSLLSVYFCDHPIEFQWWEDGETSYGISKIYDEYIPKLSCFKDYGKVLERRGKGKLDKLITDIRRLYKNLSAYVHGQGIEKREAKPLSTFPTRRITTYDKGKFNQWFDHLKRVFESCSTILIINYWNFPVDKLKMFKMLSQEQVETLLDFLNYEQNR